MKDDCIGIIDSGIGGYSILQRLQKACPYESFVYLMDKAHFPYGTKSKTELIRIMANNVEYLVSRFHIKMLVIACNTATLTTISALKKQFHLPIFGIMPTDVELKGDEVIAKPGIGFYTKVDLGIAEYHFELGAGKKVFNI